MTGSRKRAVRTGRSKAKADKKKGNGITVLWKQNWALGGGSRQARGRGCRKKHRGQISMRYNNIWMQMSEWNPLLVI